MRLIENWLECNVAPLTFGNMHFTKILSNRYDNPVIVVNGPMATRRYLGTAEFTVTGQEEILTAKNRYIDVLVKENGQWKTLWHSWIPVTWN